MPFGLAFDSSDSLYIVDISNNRVQKWLPGASNGTTVAGQESGAGGSNADFLNTPCGVVLDSSRNMYIADLSNARVQMWSNGATNGTTVAGTGKTL